MYAKVARRAGRFRPRSYHLVEDGNHVDSFYDRRLQRLRPIPPGGSMLRPESGDLVKECSLGCERGRYAERRRGG